MPTPKYIPDDTAQDDQLLDVEAAATRLGVTTRWVRRAVQERRIRFIKIGRWVRFDPVDLDEFVGDHRVEVVRR